MGPTRSRNLAPATHGVPPHGQVTPTSHLNPSGKRRTPTLEPASTQLRKRLSLGQAPAAPPSTKHQTPGLERAGAGGGATAEELFNEAGSSSGSSSETEAELAGRKLPTLVKRSRRRLKRFWTEAQTARQTGHTLLEKRSITPKVAARYRQDFAQLKAFAAKQGASLDEGADVGGLLVQLLEKEFFNGQEPSMGERLLAATMYHLPRYSRWGPSGLPRAWRAMRGWRRLCPGRSRLPRALPFWMGWRPAWMCAALWSWGCTCCSL